MKSVAFALLEGTFAVLPAAAQPAPSTLRTTCDEAIALVRREGSASFTTPLGREHFVRDRGFCELTEIAELRFVPTRDNPQCPIGYRCREPDYDDWDWDK
ncbi:hypothetical protein MMB17_07680 [Methylobacterium organophilum]|uniref:hypothetical protein n=1 Tax=Methylobacterium organophilum TaxID=410 RepID=UPI001F13C3C1|nr:hypothetical protein [Methylobacterium organophilum]UMY19168.1 hypothetical protein MMB17_07680 [Methylobacterium organophilum]